MEKKYEPKNTCEKTNLYCDQSQYGEIGLWSRLKMNFHLFFCAPCQEYSRKNSKLTKTIKKSDITCLKPQEIEQIKQVLHEKSGQ